MDMTGQERISASRDVVWAALNDPGILMQCIPRCESLEWISDHELTARVKVKVGPISAGFTIAITLSNVHGPESYTISAEGKGGLAGFAKGAANVVLQEDGGGTILHYEAGAEIGGRIAQIGSRFIGAAAGKLAQQFFADFNAAVSH
jgi:carbon monoxide dehydrogenase subunit G